MACESQKGISIMNVPPCKCSWMQSFTYVENEQNGYTHTMNASERLLYRLTQGRSLAIMLLCLVALSLSLFTFWRLRPKADYDCNDFRSQRQAQSVFNRHHQQGDIYGLDIDGDGVACESLP